ncbi:MAG: hypothetical protein EXR83_07985 [Gammaproteobacteria bacterium]|nr:hypothetical protein [Gammaproteobacteria bacterium]
MSGTASGDRQHQTYARFQAQLKIAIRGLITPALVAEHRDHPQARHSDALARVVNFFRRPPRYGLYSAVPLRQWQLIRLPIVPGAPPAPLDGPHYNSEAEAIHAVFLRHLADLQAQ